MVRFSCFPNPILNKSKKSHQRPTESLQKNLGDTPKDLMAKATGSSPCSSPLQLKAHDNRTSITSGEQMISSSSSECCLKSEEMASSFSPEDNREVLQKVRLMKSQSLGSGLYKEGRVSCVVDTEDEMDQGFFGDDSHEKSFNRMPDDFNHNELTESFDGKEPGTFMLNQSQENTIVESFHSNGDVVLNESIFSIGETQQLERELQEDTSTNLSVEHVGDSGRRTPNTTDRTARILKSCSLPNIRVPSSTLQEGLPAVRLLGRRSRSFENLHAFDFRREVLNYKSRCAPSCYNISQASPSPGKRSPCREVPGEDCVLSNPSGGSFEVADHERDRVSENGKQTSKNVFGDGCDSFIFTDLSKEWKVSEIEEVGEGNSNIPQKTPVHWWDELSCKEFHSKRIEEWISSIDLQERCSLPEIGECSDPAPKMKKDTLLISGMTAAKLDHKVTPGMELGNHYVSSLTAGSTSAQMANLGLVAIPFLSAFSSLRVLNLAGNGIVKITAGALPRGLHVLNLSKNNISTIEGLRELTRLRALDLSYNRIFRIGHGLASCSSLKELYLAGNKISEVEGLHRLLKLNILDLRFNKISTAKSLGQLAANYCSLQAIHLEGNPAQRNVGDDHLKKYLLSLLPHLLSFNRQMVSRNSLSKEIGDRPARSITSYQFDRSLRSEHKVSRRGSHGTATHKTASSSHGRSGQASGSPKPPRGRHGRHPPTGSKGFHQLNIDSRLLNFAPGLAMRRSRSEGNL